jgi:hypothetical protein
MVNTDRLRHRGSSGRFLTFGAAHAAFFGVVALTGAGCFLPEYVLSGEGENGGATASGGGGGGGTAGGTAGAGGGVVMCTDCNGVCTDLDTDPQNCGECGNACSVGECNEGSCVDTPPGPCDHLGPGFSLCGEDCKDLTNDQDNCGECRIVCETGPCQNGSCVGSPHGSCPDGLQLCGDTCVDLLTDEANCGECSSVCASTCTNGTCVTNVTDCPEGQTECDGTCTDLDTDPWNCGECGNQCDFGNGTCVAGACS